MPGPWNGVAVEQGNSTAEAWIGYLYTQGGHGIYRNDASAFEWLQKSADHENAWGTSLLAGMYKDGLGTEKDINTAAELYLKAAELGSDNAKEMLNDPEIAAAAAAISAGNG